MIFTMITIIWWSQQGSQRWWSYDDYHHRMGSGGQSKMMIIWWRWSPYMMTMITIWWRWWSYDETGKAVAFPRVAAFSSATERPGHEMEVAPPGPPGPQGPWGPSERPGHDHNADYDGNGDDHGNDRSGETCENDEMLQTQEKITYDLNLPALRAFDQMCTNTWTVWRPKKIFHSWKRRECSGGKWWKQLQQRSDMQWLIPGWAWTSRPTWTPATECLLQRRLIM